jgi:hypothetical protein
MIQKNPKMKVYLTNILGQVIFAAAHPDTIKSVCVDNY